MPAEGSLANAVGCVPFLMHKQWPINGSRVLSFRLVRLTKPTENTREGTTHDMDSQPAMRKNRKRVICTGIQKVSSSDILNPRG